MTRLSKGPIEGAFEVAEVLGEGSAALGRRLHPCAGFSLKEFFGGVDVPGILQLAQVDGEIAAGQVLPPNPVGTQSSNFRWRSDISVK